MSAANDKLKASLENVPRLTDDGVGDESYVDTLARLAALSPVQYDRVRESEAKRLHVRVTTLDNEVIKKRGNNPSSGQGQAVLFDEAEPWPEPVDGAELLDNLEATFMRYVVLPERAAEVLALWTMHTHAFNAFTHSPRLNVHSPEKGCGKTLVLDVLQELTPRALRTENISTAALFRLIDKELPTLLIDEHDSFLRDNEDLRGALNAGHKRGGRHIRVEGESYEVRTFKTFAPVALAGIGNLPGTLMDRCIMIRMKRALPGEVPERFDSRRAGREQELRRKLVRWCADNFEQLESADPEMPDGIFNRKADNWRPLLAIADAVGGVWPQRARLAAALSCTEEEESDSARAQLLADIRTLFEERQTDRLLSADLVRALAGMEERNWLDWSHGKQINTRQVASLLKPFGIAPKTLRTADGRGKGYELDQFTDAFARYLPTLIRDTVTSLENKAVSKNLIRDVEKFVTDEKTQKPLEKSLCHGVTYENPRPLSVGI